MYIPLIVSIVWFYGVDADCCSGGGCGGSKTFSCYEIGNIYRFWNGGSDHHYSWSSNEAVGYSLEGVAWKYYSNYPCGSTRLYEWYAPSVTDHLLTTNSEERPSGYE
eukprot:297731_1